MGKSLRTASPAGFPVADFGETAVDAAVARWMRLTITSKDESDYGIPAGLPYLTGFVCHCELEADTGEGLAPRAQPFV
jgi:hypothetical protein